ncbi:hypothetical protein [Streptomyces sp. NPDC059076]|uniref:hypothetical protein n=1 Tax=unclassified Streptomyces TaxID=2593676 RepID=UPI0036C84760
MTEHLSTPPERTFLSSVAAIVGPPLTHRSWRTDTHALVLGPATDQRTGTAWIPLPSPHERT